MTFRERADTRRDRRAGWLLAPRERSRSSCHPARRQIHANTRGGGDRGGASESRFRAIQMSPFSLPLLSPRTGAIDRQVKLAEALLPCSCRSPARKGRSEDDPRRLRLHACKCKAALGRAGASGRNSGCRLFAGSHRFRRRGILGCARGCVHVPGCCPSKRGRRGSALRSRRAC